MQETPWQYTRRILGYVKRRDALEVQKATPQKLERLIHGLSPKRLRLRPAPGKWSIGEILAHLADSELVVGYRIRMILSANGTKIQAFDQNAWAENSDYARQDPRRSLEQFRVLRASNVALLRALPRRKWKHYGVHEERGKETIARIVRLYAGHDSNHLRQVERISRQGESG